MGRVMSTSAMRPATRCDPRRIDLRSVRRVRRRGFTAWRQLVCGWISMDRDKENRSTGGSATATATAGREGVSGGAYEATQYLNYANCEHTGAFALSWGGELSHCEYVDDGGGLRGAAPGYLVEPSLVRTGSSTSALGNVEHDTQARPFELISKRAVLATRQESAYSSVQLQCELVTLEPLVLQPRLAAVESVARTSWCDLDHVTTSTGGARKLRPFSGRGRGRGRGRSPREPIRKSGVRQTRLSAALMLSELLLGSHERDAAPSCGKLAASNAAPSFSSAPASNDAPTTP